MKIRELDLLGGLVDVLRPDGVIRSENLWGVGHLPRGLVVVLSSSNSRLHISLVCDLLFQDMAILMTESNWLHGGQVRANFIRADDGPVTTLCMDDKYVAIGMANSRVHVFDVKTGKLKRNLYGHTQGVWALGLISKNPIEAESHFTSPTNPNHRPKTSTGGMEDNTTSRRASIDTTSSGRMQFGILPAFGILDGHPRRPSTATGYASSSGPREAKRMKSSEVCGSSMGWPGLRKDLVVSGGSDKALRVWDLETG
jgi:F-box and WD-40 domain protein CDC4